MAKAKEKELKTELVKISEISNNPNNPRYIKDDKFEKLLTSIKDFPQMLKLRPIIVDESNIVLGGNMRLKACKEAGLKEVYIVRATDLTEDQKKEFIIKDNVGFGAWEWEELANDWDALDLDEWGLDIPGFEVDEDNDKETPTEEVNFNIICDNLEELNLLQDRLKLTSKKVSYSKFIELI